MIAWAVARRRSRTKDERKRDAWPDLMPLTLTWADVACRAGSLLGHYSAGDEDA
jgi:hypothetical protein